MPRHVYVSVWDEATTQVREERACSVSVSAIGGDKQFLRSPAGASLAAPPLRHAGASGLRFFFVVFFRMVPKKSDRNYRHATRGV